MASSNQTTAQPLSDVPFLQNLAKTFNVTSIPLAIFLLIFVCIACIVTLVVIILCVKSCMRRVYLKKPKRKGLKSVYLDEIIDPISEPGMCGLLTFTLDYEVSAKRLNVVVVEAKDLQTPNETKSLDAYASIRVLRRSRGRWVPHGKCHKTDVQRRTPIPRWHYPCSFTMTENELKSCMLLIEVFDYDNLGQDRSVGRLELLLSEIDSTEYVGTTYETTKALQEGVSTYKGVGEICVGLALLTNPMRIEMFVYEARKLDISHLISPGKDSVEILVELKYKRRTLGTYETKAKVDTANPYFNEKTVFTLKEKYLDGAYLVFTLRRRGGLASLGHRRILGRAIVGTESQLTTGVKQWEEMKRNSPRTHVMWHVLVPMGEEFNP